MPSERDLALLDLMGFPFKVAPLPFCTANNSSEQGAYIRPISILLLTTKAIETHQEYRPLRKHVVPSMGSTTQIPEFL